MKYYNEIAQGYEELHKEEQLKKLKIIKENIEFGENVLDVGCGTGFCLEEIESEHKIGIDPSEELVKIGKEKGRNLIIGNGENLPFQAEEFDTIICLTAAHHFTDIKKGFSEMERVGKNNFGFSILKNSEKLNLIRKIIHETFDEVKEIEEEKDMIFICEKNST